MSHEHLASHGWHFFPAEAQIITGRASGVSLISLSLHNQSHVLGIPGTTALPAQRLAHEAFYSVLELGLREAMGFV